MACQRPPVRPSGRTLCFIRNFNIYRVYPNRISVHTYRAYTPIAVRRIYVRYIHGFLLWTQSRAVRSIVPFLFRPWKALLHPRPLTVDRYRVISAADFRVMSSTRMRNPTMIPSILVYRDYERLEESILFSRCMFRVAATMARTYLTALVGLSGKWVAIVHEWRYCILIL